MSLHPTSIQLTPEQIHEAVCNYDQVSAEFKELLRNKAPQQIRESVCNYDKVSAELKKLLGQAKGIIEVNEGFKILSDRIQASNETS